MSNKTKEISAILNSLPMWSRWNNYKDNYDTEKITVSFLDNILLAEKEEKILDFGAGFAMHEYFAKDRGIKIDSLDIDTEEVRATFKKVHEKLGLDTYLYDGVTIPFDDNSYDKIIFKASLTKMINSESINILSELLRISKPDAIWYVSPPYMIPRFITNIIETMFKNWHLGISSKELLGEVLEKNITFVMSDWVKRSTFAFGKDKLMISPIGWIPENTFDFDALRINYKYGYPKGTSFYALTYNMSHHFQQALLSITKVREIKDRDALELANKDLSDFFENFAKHVSRVEAERNKSRIVQHGRVSTAYKGKTYIFARGKSAGHKSLVESDLKATKDDTVIYVNDWKKPLTEYFYSNFSENSINIHFLNRDVELNILSARQYFDKTFALLQSNSIQGEERDIIVKIENTTYGVQQTVAQIPKNSIKENVKTAGLHAVFYAVNVLKRKNIEIYGLDFFEANYLTEHVVSRKPEPMEHQPAKGKIAKAQFLKLVKDNPNVTFTINTFADFSNNKLKNLIVNQFKE